MSPRLTILLRMRIWGLLLLAAIGLQAAEPIRAPLERASGSAWSSATSELALASSRRGEDASVQPQPQPPEPMAPAPGRPAPPEFEALVQASATPWFDARGPPWDEHPARPPRSTAPPVA